MLLLFQYSKQLRNVKISEVLFYKVPKYLYTNCNNDKYSINFCAS